MNVFIQLLLMSLTVILVENFVLVQFLGICPFLGVSKKVDTAVGMGLAVTFVMAIASLFTYLVQKYILDMLQLQYLQTIVFILIIAALVQLVEMFLRKSSPALYNALGIYLPLITTNCAVLGVTIKNITLSATIENFSVLHAVWYGASAGLSFLLAILLMAGVRERLESANIPKALKGFPIALISASLLAIAFRGFHGMKF